MANLATITTKRQLTIPADIFKQARLKENQKVLVEEENGTIKITPAVNLVKKLAGSLKTPSRFRGLNLNQIISKAKKAHLAKINSR